VSLALESSKNTLLIDLSLPLGDAAINLGLEPKYSTMDALENSDRLDLNLLSTLLVRHSSGLSVLAAPTDFTSTTIGNDAIDRLLSVALQAFDYVVVDAGSRQDAPRSMPVNECATLYLVTQVGIAELRNSNRFIRSFLQTGGPKLEVVVNRYDSGSSEISDEEIRFALTLPTQWKIPNNYEAVQRMQTSATPLMLEDTTISRAIRQMACAVCGKTEAPEKKKRRFRFFG
jgi:pilus assembly protein CpaE